MGYGDGCTCGGFAGGINKARKRYKARASRLDASRAVADKAVGCNRNSLGVGGRLGEARHRAHGRGATAGEATGGGASLPAGARTPGPPARARSRLAARTDGPDAPLVAWARRARGRKTRLAPVAVARGPARGPGRGTGAISVAGNRPAARRAIARTNSQHATRPSENTTGHRAISNMLQ